MACILTPLSRNGIVFVLRSMFVRFFPLFPFHKIFINNNNEGFCMPQDEKERERALAREGAEELVVFCVFHSCSFPSDSPIRH